MDEQRYEGIATQDTNLLVNEFYGISVARVSMILYVIFIGTLAQVSSVKCYFSISPITLFYVYYLGRSQTRYIAK